MPDSFRARSALAVALVLTLSLALRWDVISTGGSLNPDEGEILAAGRRAAMQLWLPMSTSSANTYFPLWPSFLGALGAMGMPMTMTSAHVLSALLAAGILCMLWVGTARRWGWLPAAVLLAPGAWALLSSTTDFKQLSTELPSIFLLVLAALIAFPPDTVVSGRRLALAVAIASLAPWFKPQSGPLAVSVVVSALVFSRLCREKKWDKREWSRRAAWVAVGGLGPSTLLVGLMVLGGTFDIFWQEPVGFLIAYLTHNVRGLGVGAQTASIGTKVLTLALYSATQFFVAFWVVVGARGVWLMQGASTRRVLAGLTVWGLPIIASLFTLLVQWPIFPHYLLFLYAGAAISAVAGTGLPCGKHAAGREQLLVHLFRDASVSRVVALSVIASLTLLSVARPTIETGTNDRRDPAVSDLCASGNSVFIWGWVAELYAYYDWKPASRFVTYGLLRAQTPHQQDYRDRFLDEMRSAPPHCVISAVGEGWFRSEGTDVADLEREMPSIQPMLHDCYQRHEVNSDSNTALLVWRRLPDC